MMGWNHEEEGEDQFVSASEVGDDVSRGICTIVLYKLERVKESGGEWAVRREWGAGQGESETGKLRKPSTVAVLVTGHPAKIVEYFGIYKSKKYDKLC
jgi:hypothetical protein